MANSKQLFFCGVLVEPAKTQYFESGALALSGICPRRPYFCTQSQECGDHDKNCRVERGRFETLSLVVCPNMYVDPVL